MMMVFGLFVFELRTLPYQQLQLSRNWRHVKNDRVGRSAKWQYVGAGENQLTLGGLLYPEITGGNLSLGAVSTMAYTFTGCMSSRACRKRIRSLTATAKRKELSSRFRCRGLMRISGSGCKVVLPAN